MYVPYPPPWYVLEMLISVDETTVNTVACCRAAAATSTSHEASKAQRCG